MFFGPDQRPASGNGGSAPEVTIQQQRQLIEALRGDVRVLSKTVDSLTAAVETQRAQMSAHGDQLHYLSEHVGGSIMQRGAGDPSSRNFGNIFSAFSDDNGGREQESPLWFIAGWLVAPMLVLAKGLWTIAAPLVYTYRSLSIFSVLRGDPATIIDRDCDDEDDDDDSGANEFDGHRSSVMSRNRSRRGRSAGRTSLGADLHTPYSDDGLMTNEGGGGNRMSAFNHSIIHSVREYSVPAEAMQLDLGMELLQELELQ